MPKKTKKAAAVLAALLLCGGLAALPCRAAVPISPKEVTVQNIRCADYPHLYVGVNGTNVGGYLINETTYVALRAFAEAEGVYKTAYDAGTRTASINCKGLSLQVRDGEHILRVNGRCFYMDSPAKILSDGRFYLPVRPLAKAFGATVEWDNATRRVSVSASAGFCADAAATYDADVLYWLSRIISAESRGEPFLGQIAVGNVVLNRVASAEFPNTVWGVIFDRKYGVQFTPVANGTIYETPAACSVEAAKICLEGYSVSESVLYFYDPVLSTSSWIGRNRPFAFQIGGHRFHD